MIVSWPSPEKVPSPLSAGTKKCWKRICGYTASRDAKPLPFFYDLRGWFAVQGVDPRGRHSCEIGPALGVPFAGRIHNALDDARSLAAGMEVDCGAQCRAQARGMSRPYVV